STLIPPAMARGAWHLDPANLRTFDIELAKQKLLDAGYKLDANGKRLDKELKPIVLRMVVPDTSSTYAQSAEFITDWWKQLGIDMTTQAYDSDTLVEKMLPPEGEGKADFDVAIWNWGGDVDPNSLLDILTTGAIGAASDTFFSNPRYDELMTLQYKESDPVKRKAYIDEMQQIMYDEAPYHILFYDYGLHAYRTDRFGGWKLQPSADGLPFFGYGAVNYTELTAPEPEATPTPAASAEAPAPGASATPVPAETGSTGGDSTPLIVAVGALVVVGIAAVIFARRRGTQGGEEEE
ncbi:MAG TPA: ABC transporter substrate-binding protein, partial [Candidatus Limnocylindrales bacterium]